MKEFLIKLVVFSVIILSSLGLFGIAPESSQKKSDYMSAVIDKHHRLASLGSRRILLVGGSNVAFGVNSKRIQDTLKIPVVNLALHAGLGLDFTLNEAAQVSRKGDIIILSPEYYSGEADPALRAKITEAFPEVSSYYSSSLLSPLKLYFMHQVDHMRERAIHTPVLSSFFNIRVEELPAKPEEGGEVYARHSFNEYGDAIGHLNKATPEHKGFDDKLVFAYRYYEGIDKINSFYESCKAKGVKVVMLYPALAQSTYLVNKEVINRYQSDFSKNAKFPILNTPTSLVFPDDFFFDTFYHLTKQGREIRTSKIIDALVKQGIN